MSQKHFSILERESILELLTLGFSYAEIGRNLNKHRSNIGREIKRNSISGKYSPYQAQKQYETRKKNCGAVSKLKDDQYALAYIKCKIKLGWTPEQISGRSKMLGILNISFKTIYNAIKLGFVEEVSQKNLPRKGKKKPNGIKETRGKIPNKKMIEERCEKAENRSEIGHFESDTIIGSGKQGAIMTYVCRKSRFLIAKLMPDRKALTFNEATIKSFKALPDGIAKTFTSDNGKEFSKFTELEKEVKVECYFANPYHSWERGTNENTNGLLRRYFPKGTNFKELTNQMVNNAVLAINNRPRKCLKFKTPLEFFWGEVNVAFNLTI